MFSFHSSSMARNPSSTIAWPSRMQKRVPRDSVSFAERGATSTMQKAAGRIASAGAQRRVPEHVLDELLADEHAPISEPNTMIPASAPTQNVGRAATFRS